MNLHLSWDLFIFVFFAVVVAYSFIIGRNQTLKVIIGTYVAILCADGTGNIFSQFFVSSKPFLKFLALFSVTNESQAIAFFKVLVLLVLVVAIAVKGLFEVNTSEDDGPFSLRFGMLVFLGILSGGLMISAVLVFISGTSLIGSSSIGAITSVAGGATAAAGGAAAAGVDKNMIIDVYNNSRMVKIMLDYANFWFFMPGIFFIILGWFQRRSS